MNLRVVGGSQEVHVADGLLAASVAGAPELDATGLVVAPGLIDLQVNGAHGVDITAQPHRLWEVAAALPAYGVTAFLPTLITSSPEARAAALEALAAGRPAGVPAGAVPLGLHFEGPMIAESHKGAHPAHWLAPASLDLVSGWPPGPPRSPTCSTPCRRCSPERPARWALRSTVRWSRACWSTAITSIPPSYAWPGGSSGLRASCP